MPGTAAPWVPALLPAFLTQANTRASTFWEAQGFLRCLCLQFLGAACV